MKYTLIFLVSLVAFVNVGLADNTDHYTFRSADGFTSACYPADATGKVTSTTPRTS